MRAKLLFWIVLLVVSSVSPDGDPGAKLNVELVAADFQTLAHVTNAIALQAAVIQKSVPARQVIVELLKISPKEFADIISVDTVTIIKSLKSLKERIKKFGAVDEKSIDEFVEFRKHFNKMNNFVKDSTKYPNQADESSENLTIALTEIYQDPGFIETNCSNSMLESVVKLKEVLDSPDVTDQAMKNKTDMEHHAIMKRFEENYEAFVICYQSLEGYAEQFQSRINYSAFDSYLRSFQIAKESPVDLLNLKNQITKLVGSPLIQTGGVWDHTEKLTGSLGSQIQKTNDAHRTHSLKLEQPFQAYTAGFLNPKELLSVFDDLKSPWLEKHFIRGASVKKLEDDLAPFREISKKVVVLDENWQPFDRFNSTANNKIAMRKVSERLTYLEELFKRPAFSSGLQSFLNSQKEVFDECYSSPTADYKNLMGEFDKQEDAKTNFTTAIMHLNRLVNDGLLDSKGFENTTKYVLCLDQTRTEMKVYFDDNTPSSAKKATTYMKPKFMYCVNPTGGFSFGEFLENFKKFHGNQTAVLETMKIYKSMPQTNDGITFKQVFEKAKVVESMQCVKEKQLDVESIFKLVEFVKSLRRLPSLAMLDYVIGYLGRIDKIKSAMKATEDKIHELGTRSKRATTPADHPVLALNNSKLHAENIAGCTRALWDLSLILQKKQDLLYVGSAFDDDALEAMRGMSIRGDFLEPRTLIKSLITQAESIELLAGKLRNQSLMNQTKIFQETAILQGLIGARDSTWKLAETYKKDPKYDRVIKEWETLSFVNLDFKKYQTRLNQGPSTINALTNYFDEIFGRAKKPEPQIMVVEKHSYMSWVAIISISFAVVLLTAVTILTAYGFTKKGKEKYKNLYLFYFGKPADFEKRWRYSCFADKEQGKNILVDSVRELNKTNVSLLCKKGAYINAYNYFGNTSLHFSVKSGQPELVEVLIRNGADRTLLNVKNRTPIQCIPPDYKEKQPERADRYDKIQKIFKKYQNKKFRIRVPLKFPVSSFHIYLDEGPDQKIIDQFVAQFESIASYEILPNTTHCIVKTNADGIFEAEFLEQLSFILRGIIIVNSSWMQDCINDEKVLDQDSKYLVEKVKYKGVVYDTVLQWSMAMAKSEIPYLFGVFLVVTCEVSDLTTLIGIISHHGGTVMGEFPSKDKYRIGSRPYLHANLGPLFLIYDGKQDLSEYKNDPDKMYTLFTEDEFMAFMLKREINRDTREKPPTVSKDEE